MGGHAEVALLAAGLLGLVLAAIGLWRLGRAAPRRPVPRDTTPASSSSTRAARVRFALDDAPAWRVAAGPAPAVVPLARAGSGPRAWAGRVAFAAGIVAIGVGLAGWRVAAAPADAGVRLTLTSAPTGELGLAPAGALLDGVALAPGGRPTAPRRLAVRNETGRTLAVRLRAASETADVDDALALRIGLPGQRPFDATLAQLRAGTRRAFRIEAGRTAEVAVSAFVAAPDGRGLRGRAEAVTLELVTTPVRARR